MILPIEESVLLLLKHRKIRVAKTFCRRLMTTHSDYPSLLCVADTLERLRLNHGVHRISAEESIDCKLPFLAHFNRGAGEVLLIRNKKEVQQHILQDSHFSGIVVEVDDDAAYLDSEHQAALAKETTYSKLVLALALFSAASLVWLALFSTQDFNAPAFSLSVLGVFFALALITKKRSVVEFFCLPKLNMDCDASMQSAETFIIKPFTFSASALSYFLTQTAFTFLPITSNFAEPAREAMSALSLLVVLYSLIRQYQTKKWCSLCIGLNLILITQAVIIFSQVPAIMTQEISSAALGCLLACFIFAAVLSAITIIQSLFDHAVDLETRAVQAERVKHHIHVFKALLPQEHNAVDRGSDNLEFTVGNRSATLKLSFVTNLHCIPCMESHRILKDILAIYPADVCVTFKFFTDMNNPGSQSNNATIYFVSCLLSALERGDDELVSALFTDWYQHMDFQRFKLKHLSDLTSERISIVMDILNEHMQWIMAANVSRTPSIFINGSALPDGYRLEDILAMIPVLKEELNSLTLA